MLFFPIQISIWRQIPRESTKERWTSYHAFTFFSMQADSRKRMTTTLVGKIVEVLRAFLSPS